jgi:hypothetical protein
MEDFDKVIILDSRSIETSKENKDPDLGFPLSLPGQKGSFLQLSSLTAGLVMDRA